MSREEVASYAKDMQKRRMGAAHAADYADQVTGLPNTSDPTGNYVCGGCNKRDNRGDGKRCLLVKVDNLDPNTGSCNKWEIECAGDPEHDNQVLSIDEAGYVVGTHPFGCNRCNYASDAGFVDELGRTLWCKLWAFTVHPKKSCCAKNDTPEYVIKEDGSIAPGHKLKEDDDDDMPKNSHADRLLKRGVISLKQYDKMVGK